MIDKINNIPFKFDLYISTDTNKKKNIIEKYMKKNTKASYYKILVIDNKGRNLLPMLIQMRHKITNYEYFCHIHSKKEDKLNSEIYREIIYIKIY